MNQTYDLLQWALLASYCGLAVVATVHFFKRKVGAGLWLALSFLSFAAVVVAGRLLPEQAETTAQLAARKALVAVLVLFPYFLFRFMAQMVGVGRKTNIAANVLTILVVAGAIIVTLPSQGEPRDATALAYLNLLLVQWVFLTVVFSWRLWKAGRLQPTFARRRTQALVLGAATIAATLVVSAQFPADDEISAFQILVQILALSSGILFLIGFAPPTVIRSFWRNRDERELRDAQAHLVRATTPQEVAQGIVPAIGNLFGALGAEMKDLNGTQIGSWGEIPEQADPSASGTAVMRVPLEGGELNLYTSPLTPYFVSDELRTLEALGVLTDMALGRAQVAERARKNSEAMNEFVAIASHDLRTPLAVVKGITATLLSQWEHLSEAQRRDFLERADKQAGRLTRLVEDLLTVSKIESGVMEPKPQELDLGNLAHDSVAMLGEDAAGVTVSIPPATKVLADPDHVRRIFDNLISNALNHGEPPIEITVKSGSYGTELRVADAGDGIPEEFVQDLFKKFARVDKKMSRSTGGTGLGLSIVQGLASASGGKVWFEPNSPKGAVFGVSLPTRLPDRSDIGQDIGSDYRRGRAGHEADYSLDIDERPKDTSRG